MSIKGFEVGGVQERYDYTALDNTPANLVQDANYVHTDNNFTNADKTKLDGIATGANKTIIDSTLTQSGQAADAKATGDELDDLKSAFTANLIHDTATGSIANFPDGAAMPVLGLSVDIEPVQAGSGDPSPNNVRPITGWTGAKVMRTGKNLFDPDSSDNLWVGADNAILYPPSAKSVTIPAQAGQVLTASMSNTRTSSNLLLLVYFDIGGNILSRNIVAFSEKVLTVTAPANTASALCSLYTYSEAGDVQLELGSTATAYEPYQGNTYSIKFPTEAGTVYGGTLDVTQGKLTVAYSVVDLGTMVWNKGNRNNDDTGYVFSTGSIADTISHDYTTVKAICSIAVQKMPRYPLWERLANGEFQCEPTGNVVFVADYPDTSAFKTAVTGQTLVYELATPIEITLTPTQIDTLLGTNNIFADCGDTTVDYYADPTLYINRKIAAAVAAMS